MSRWRFLRRLNPVRITARIFGILLCLELPPPKVLPTILRISPLIALEPESIPVDVALHGCPPGLWTIRLMTLLRVKIELNGITQSAQTSKHFIASR